LEKALFEVLPQDGQPILIESCRRALAQTVGGDMSADKFFEFVFQLGGMVVVDAATDTIRLSKEANLPLEIGCERDLEGWFERYLVRQAESELFDPRPPSLSLVIENTARVSGIAGTFVKPDICMGAVSRYHYSPSVHFDLFCFELKMPNGCNNASVMQALSNAIYCHYNFLVIYLPPGWLEEPYLDRIKLQAIHHGVGIIRIADHLRDGGYQVILPGRRQSPRPGDTERFIESRFTEASRMNLRKWVHP
jgi:hypothetical protein